jgi:heme exporter protein D
MSGIMSFLAMGGYAAYVWPAYGVAGAVLAWMTLDSLVSYRRRRRELAALEPQRAVR